MQQRLKERLVGATVLVIVAVVFVPMILTGPVGTSSITDTNIPEWPDEKYGSRLLFSSNMLESIQMEARENVVRKGPPSEENVEINDQPMKQQDALMEKTEVKQNKDIPEDALMEKTEVKQNKDIPEKQLDLPVWIVQLGSFSNKLNAEKLEQKLRKEGFSAFIESVQQKQKTAYRVRVGPELLRSDADELLVKIKEKMKLNGVVLPYVQ